MCRHCSHHSNEDLLDEVILAIGYFCVLNPENQVCGEKHCLLFPMIISLDISSVWTQSYRIAVTMCSSVGLFHNSKVFMAALSMVLTLRDFTLSFRFVDVMLDNLIASLLWYSLFVK